MPATRSPSAAAGVRSGVAVPTHAPLFTDVEGSTKLLHELGDEEYEAALAGAPACDPRVVHASIRCRGRYPRRCPLRRISDGTGCPRGGRRGARRARCGPDPGAYGHPYRDTARWRGRLCRSRRAPRLAYSRLRPRRAGADLSVHCFPPRQRTDYATSGCTDSMTSLRPSASISSETPTSRRSESLHQTNLPIPSTPFLGREQELERGARPALARGRPPAHSDGGGRHRQDAPRRARAGLLFRPVPARSLVGTPCSAP